MASGAFADERERALMLFVQTKLRRNFTCLSADYGSFNLGMTFASLSTILPAFAEHLGASNLLIGAIPAITTLGYALPPLLTANLTERLPRKLGFILAYTVWERVPLLALAAGAYLLAESHPGIVLALLLACLAAISGVGGALTPAWMDMIGKVIPTNYRGRLFALSNILGAGLGLGGTAVVAHYLATYRFPLSYALSFATGFGFLALSFVFLALVAEPPLASNKPHVDFATYVRQLSGVLARDRDLTWFLASRAIGVFGTMAGGFFTVFALRTLGAAEWEVARFTFILLAGQTVANAIFGYVADQVGHKPVMVAGTLSTVAACAVALFCTRVEEVYVVFLAASVSIAATGISSLNLAMEFASAHERPTYVALASSLTAPLAFLAPLLGGLLADWSGYRTVFALSAVAAGLSVLLLAARVRDPRSRELEPAA